MNDNKDFLPETETHPWPPYIPPEARILILGTFPPQAKRWSMDFYYPNRTNDFWPMMAHIFYGNRNALNTSDNSAFNLDAIKELLNNYRIALNDTGRVVRRLKGNASDKFLEIVEPVRLGELLKQMPSCHTVATTGEKAASVIAELTGTEMLKMGGHTVSPSGLNIWRMPSTSRAYPMKLEKKADYYRNMFVESGILKEV